MNTKSYSRQLTSCLSLLLVLAAPASAKTPEDVLGRWASEGSIIEITVQNDALSAKVVALMEPTYAEGALPDR